MPDAHSAGKDSTVFERALVAANARRVFRLEEAVLGATLVGKRILLRDGRNSNARDDKGIYKEPI
jgi:hypothetical protein